MSEPHWESRVKGDPLLPYEVHIIRHTSSSDDREIIKEIRQKRKESCYETTHRLRSPLNFKLETLPILLRMSHDEK
jgi:hypothetical protein